MDMNMQDDARTNRAETVKLLTTQMNLIRPFSYLRMGDGELRWLLDVQRGQEPSQQAYKINEGSSVNAAFGVRGVKLEHYERLMQAYENCNFIDLYERVPYNYQNLSSLKMNTSPETYRAAGSASKIVLEWTNTEFKSYISDKKCLFVCAESPLLEKLYQDARYQEIAAKFWSSSPKPIFLNPRNDGRFYWEVLDQIKEDIRQVIINEAIDTVFISLGSGAKILCYELAKELRICAFDWGASSRALAYAGSPGYHSARAPHSPFFFRVPLNIYMEALEKAYPNMSIPDLISKVHAQLCLDLQKKVVAGSTAADACQNDSFDPSAENIQNFWESYRYYVRKYIPQAKGNDQAEKLIQEFYRYRLVKGIGVDGTIYKSLAQVKKLLRSATKFV
jgi:hypothetical protein